MKTIGIMTFHGADNYGAVLQAYALSTFLKEEGFLPEIIDYRSKVYDRYAIFRKSRYKRIPILIVEDLMNWRKNRNRKVRFDQFRKNYLPISSDSFLTFESLNRISDSYDYYICGSDQIWNPNISKGIDPAYLLEFVKSSSKKISFAPSLGVESLPELYLWKIEKAIRSFRAVSVREQNGVDLLQTYCNQKIECVCDPVFLLNQDHYELLCRKKITFKFIFLYVIGSARQNRRIIQFAEEIAAEKHLQLIYLIDGNTTLYRIKGKDVKGSSIEDFLSYIKNAECVISNSFHATVFSILFSKQFVSFPKEETNSRLTNILQELSLSERIYKKGISIDENIDYDSVMPRLQQMRDNAVHFLFSALSISGVKQDDRVLSTNHEYIADQKYKALCEKVESVKNQCFLAINNDALVRQSSRSGGIFTPISDLILQKGGAVYGCRLEKIDKAVHFRATTVEERNQFRGSKYIQSEMGDCYQQVKEDLKQGKAVLFSGTPCQIAGLNKYLDKEDTQNLLTMDIVCHGVPSPVVWRKYLEWMARKHNGAVEAVDFRDKRYGWRAHFESVKIKGKWHTTSVFRILFYKHLILRPSCYQCPFANINRQGDITIGDAWGIEKANPSWDDDKGASLVIINSEKGKQAFEAVQSLLCVQSVDIEDYMQPNLKGPSERNKDRDAFWHELSEKGFEHILSKYAKQGRKKTIKDEIVLIGTKMHLNGLIKKLTK